MEIRVRKQSRVEMRIRKQSRIEMRIRKQSRKEIRVRKQNRIKKRVVKKRRNLCDAYLKDIYLIQSIIISYLYNIIQNN